MVSHYTSKIKNMKLNKNEKEALKFCQLVINSIERNILLVKRDDILWSAKSLEKKLNKYNNAK